MQLHKHEDNYKQRITVFCLTAQYLNVHDYDTVFYLDVI